MDYFIPSGGVKELLYHSAISGAFAAGTAKVMFPGSVVLPVLSSSRLSVWQVAALLGVVTGAASTGLHYFVKEEIPLSEKANDMASVALGAVASGMFYTGGLYMLGGGQLVRGYGLVPAIATGAAMDYAASFLTNMLYGA